MTSDYSICPFNQGRRKHQKVGGGGTGSRALLDNEKSTKKFFPDMLPMGGCNHIIYSMLYLNIIHFPKFQIANVQSTLLSTFF